MSTKTLNVSDRVLKRATELATLAGVSVDRLLEEMLDSSVPVETAPEDLPPHTRALSGILKGLPDKSYKEYAAERAIERDGR